MIKFNIMHFEAVLSENFTLPQGFENLACFKKPLDLGFIPPLERRRLNKAAGCAFFLYEKFAFKAPPLLVFSSYEGEVNNCYAMLNQIIANEPLSPNAFSLSVLNATPALLAIKKQNHGEITAMSANPAFEYAIINAYAKLFTQKKDEAFVMSYYEKLAANSDGIEFLMLACKMSLESPNFALKYSVNKNASTEKPSSARLSELDFLANALEKTPKFSVKNEDMLFEWSRL